MEEFCGRKDGLSRGENVRSAKGACAVGSAPSPQASITQNPRSQLHPKVHLYFTSRSPAQRYRKQDDGSPLVSGRGPHRPAPAARGISQARSGSACAGSVGRSQGGEREVGVARRLATNLEAALQTVSWPSLPRSWPSPSAWMPQMVTSASTPSLRCDRLDQGGYLTAGASRPASPFPSRRRNVLQFQLSQMWVGRWAMLGFVSSIVVEATSGRRAAYRVLVRGTNTAPTRT